MTKGNNFTDENSERLLLGCMLNDNRCIADIISRLTGNMFTSSRYRIIYETLVQLYNSGASADICTLTTALTNKGLLEEAGGAALIAGLTNEVSTSSNFAYYKDNVLKKAQARAFATSLHESMSRLGSIDTSSLMKELEDKIFRISAATNSTKIWNAEELATAANEYFRYCEETWNVEKGIRTGFPTLDRLTDGFQPGDLIVIGARPSIGKTAIAVTMMKYLAERNIPFGFFSAEMLHEQIMNRFIVQRAKVDLATIRSGRYDPDVKTRLQEAAAYYGSRKFYVDDTSNIDLNSLISSARHMKFHYGIQAIYIDYIGLITCEDKGQYWEKFMIISRSLKALARELKVPVIVLSQLGREAEGKEPNLSNIKGSGAIEQDADMVIFLDGDREVDSYKSLSPYLNRTMILAKNRNGPCGTVYLDFEKQYALFTEAEDQDARRDEELAVKLKGEEYDNYMAARNRETVAIMNERDRQKEEGEGVQHEEHNDSRTEQTA